MRKQTAWKKVWTAEERQKDQEYSKNLNSEVVTTYLTVGEIKERYGNIKPMSKPIVYVDNGNIPKGWER
jgi:hypothetical protein